MIYPVHTRDLTGIDVDNDEHATLIVIEAMATSSLNELDFIDSIDVDEIEHRVRTWEGFDEYSAMITEQKNLLRGPIQHVGVPLDSLSAAQEHIASQLALNAVDEFEPKKQGSIARRSMVFASVAASVLVVTLGVSLAVRNSDPAQVQNRGSMSVSGSSSPLQENTSSGESVTGVQPEADSEKVNPSSARNTTTNSDPDQGNLSLNGSGGGGDDIGSADVVDTQSGQESSKYNIVLRIVMVLGVFLVFTIIASTAVLLVRRKKT